MYFESIARVVVPSFEAAIMAAQRLRCTRRQGLSTLAAVKSRKCLVVIRLHVCENWFFGYVPIMHLSESPPNPETKISMGMLLPTPKI